MNPEVKFASAVKVFSKVTSKGTRKSLRSKLESDLEVRHKTEEKTNVNNRNGIEIEIKVELELVGFVNIYVEVHARDQVDMLSPTHVLARVEFDKVLIVETLLLRICKLDMFV